MKMYSSCPRFRSGRGKCTLMGHPLKLPSPTKLAWLGHFPPASQAGRCSIFSLSATYRGGGWGGNGSKVWQDKEQNCEESLPREKDKTCKNVLTLLLSTIFVSLGLLDNLWILSSTKEKYRKRPRVFCCRLIWVPHPHL
jgi:hypothetical protein